MIWNPVRVFRVVRGDDLPRATRWTVWDSRSLPAKLLASSNTHDMNFVRTFFKP
jgi:hypothetical protein